MFNPLPSFTMPIILSRDFKRHLRWWALESRYVQGVSMVEVTPELFLTTDASSVGWGAHLEPLGLLFQRVLVSSGVPGSHKHAGVESGRPSTPSSLSTCTGQSCPGSHGQYDGCGIFEQTGGHPFSFSLLADNAASPVVPGSSNRAEDSSHPREIEYTGGLPIQIHQTSADRVGTEERYSFSSNRELGGSHGRSICDEGKCQTPIVCIPSSRCVSVGRRRNVLRVEESGRVCISAVCVDTKGPPEGSVDPCRMTLVAPLWLREAGSTRFWRCSLLYQYRFR